MRSCRTDGSDVAASGVRVHRSTVACASASEAPSRSPAAIAVAAVNKEKYPHVAKAVEKVYANAKQSESTPTRRANFMDDPHSVAKTEELKTMLR